MSHQVSTRVYTYNPNGIGVLILFIFGVIVLIHQLLTMHTLIAGIIACILLAIYIYVRYTNNPKWRIQVWDERRLIFSSDAIRFGQDKYPITELETAAVYLESFDGFKYRALGMIRSNMTPGVVVQRKADGDNNKISFRRKGEVEDFTFYLANYAQYAELRSAMNDWSAAGVNVVVRQIFEDDFIVSEMMYFNTAAGNV